MDAKYWFRIKILLNIFTQIVSLFIHTKNTFQELFQHSFIVFSYVMDACAHKQNTVGIIVFVSFCDRNIIFFTCSAWKNKNYPTFSRHMCVILCVLNHTSRFTNMVMHKGKNWSKDCVRFIVQIQPTYSNRNTFCFMCI